MGATGFAPTDLIVLAVAAFLVGMRRAGVQGPAVLAVVLMASHFTAAASIGVAVVIFLYADIQATILLFGDVDWGLLVRLLIPTVVGIVVAALVGRSLPGEAFEWILFTLVLLAYGSLLYQHVRHGGVVQPEYVPSFVTPLAGFLSGFTTMIGNLASVFVLIYFATIGAKKDTFIATSVLFFFAVNLIKLPIHIWVWKTISGPAAARTLFLIPVVTIGFLTGRLIVRRLSEQVYWRFVTVIAGLALIRYFLVIVGAEA